MASDFAVVDFVFSRSPTFRTIHDRMLDHKAEHFCCEIPVLPGGGIVDTLKGSIRPIRARQPSCGSNLATGLIDSFVDFIHDTTAITWTQPFPYEFECTRTPNFRDFLAGGYVDQHECSP